jgi:hypothetical protein
MEILLHLVEFSSGASIYPTATGMSILVGPPVRVSGEKLSRAIVPTAGRIFSKVKWQKRSSVGPQTRQTQKGTPAEACGGRQMELNPQVFGEELLGS